MTAVRRMRRATRMLALASATTLGCHDVVIGTFGGSSGDASGGGGSSSGGTGGSETTGGALLPGECIEAPFDDAPLDPQLWATWADGDALVTTGNGVLTLRPPSGAELGTGVVLLQDHAVPFDTAHTIIEVITPPDPTSDSELFLQVTQQVPPTDAVLALGLRADTVIATARGDDGTQSLFEPVATGTPRWIGLRVADGTAYFETSEDGVAWTIVASVPSPSDFVGASPLVMVWNNAGAGVSDPQPVVVDGWEICAD